MNDADIEMAQLTELGNRASYAKRRATHEPTPADLKAVEECAYQACYYYSPVMENVVELCVELGIDSGHEAVTAALFRGSDRAKAQP
jgi:hypothetical protein